MERRQWTRRKRRLRAEHGNGGATSRHGNDWDVGLVQVIVSVSKTAVGSDVDFFGVPLAEYL
jgi:hypothetical protein